MNDEYEEQDVRSLVAAGSFSSFSVCSVPVQTLAVFIVCHEAVHVEICSHWVLLLRLLRYLFQWQPLLS